MRCQITTFSITISRMRSWLNCRQNLRHEHRKSWRWYPITGHIIANRLQKMFLNSILINHLGGYVDCNGVVPLVQGHMPRQVVGLVKMLGEYQALAAEAAWSGKRNDAIRALASHPLVFSLYKAEAIYDEMAAAHKQYLPERLLQ